MLDETPSILQVLWNSQDWHCHMAYVAPLRAKGWNKARLSYIYIVCIIELYMFLYYSLYNYTYLGNFNFDTKLRFAHFRPPESRLCVGIRVFVDQNFVMRSSSADVAQQPFLFFCSRDTERSFERSLDSCGPSRVEYVKCWRSQTSRTSTQVKSM